MKLESLSIIFIIIVLPISMILSQYVERKVNVAKTELQYDTRLLNSTYDAIKTYQLNTINNSFGDVTNSKIQDIEAAVSSFQNSLANNFGYTGSRASIMKQYVPAIAFTLYDGYYVYSPFYNTLTDLDTSNVDESYSKPESYTDGLKPYVYYSCRYVRDNDDFIITYSLDNYITIQGKIKGSYHYDYGYLYSIASNKNENGIYYDESNNQCYYNGIQFNDYSNNSYDTEELKEFIGNTEYSYAKINGKKYYLEHSSNSMYETITVDNGGINLTIDTNAKFFYLNSKGEKIYAQVGSFCSIAEDCTIGGGAHPVTWVSTSPVFYLGKNSLHKNISENEFKEYICTIIGNDVWIGSKCLIKGGVTIGDGAIIGMGSVVTHDVPPYEIWAGNPARCIRKRFDEETIKQLLGISWWNWDEEKLRELGDFFNSPEEFLRRCK